MSASTPAPLPPPACRDCVFYYKTLLEPLPVCRAHPPQIFCVGNRVGSGWPVIPKEDCFCGFFTPKPGLTIVEGQ